MSEYLKFYFVVEEDVEIKESILTERANAYDKTEFVRRCFHSYIKLEWNVGKAFDEEGYTYNYSEEKQRAFRSREPDPQVIAYIEDNTEEESEFGY